MALQRCSSTFTTGNVLLASLQCLGDGARLLHMEEEISLQCLLPKKPIRKCMLHSSWTQVPSAICGFQLHKKSHLIATPVLTILAIGHALIEPLAHRYSPSCSSFTLSRYLINYNCLHTKSNCCCQLYLCSFSLSSVWKFAWLSMGEAHLASFQVMKSFLVISWLLFQTDIILYLQSLPSGMLFKAVVRLIIHPLFCHFQQ